MAASRSNFAYSIEDGSSDYGSIGSRDSLSIQDKPKTESCVGAACKKLSKIGKKLKKKFTRKNRKNSYDSLLRGSFDENQPIRYSDLTDRPSFIEVGGRRKRRRRRTRKKKGGKRRRTRKKRKSRKRRKKRKTRRRR